MEMESTALPTLAAMWTGPMNWPPRTEQYWWPWTIPISASVFTTPSVLGQRQAAQIQQRATTRRGPPRTTAAACTPIAPIPQHATTTPQPRATMEAAPTQAAPILRRATTSLTLVAMMASAPISVCLQSTPNCALALHNAWILPWQVWELKSRVCFHRCLKPTPAAGITLLEQLVKHAT